MKWLPTGLALAALLGITGISSTPSVAAVAAPAGDDRCTASDVQRLAHHIFDVVTLAWTDDGSAEEAQADHLFEDCQFRLYDDNDPEDNPDNPEIPHVFSEDDYFLAGISAGYTYAELEELGFTRAEAIAEMNKFTDRFFWGPATATDAELEEIKLASTPYLGRFSRGRSDSREPHIRSLQGEQTRPRRLQVAVGGVVTRVKGRVSPTVR